MNDENYYVVQGWMINRLKLSGIRLHTFAIIYGFSQHNGNEFNGSIKYFCAALGCSANSVRACLKDLQTDGLITKKISYAGGVISNSYSVNHAVICKLKGEGVQNLQGVQKLVPYNINYNTTNNKDTKHTKTPSINNTSNKELNIQGTIGSNNTMGTIGNKAKTAPAQRVLIQPKTAKNGAPCGFSGRGGVSALFNEIEGGKAVLDKFSLFVKSAQEAGMKVGRVWLRAQVDLINWVEDPDDKILVLQKTMERGWKSLRFVVEEMFGCKIESQRKNIITKTKIGGCKYD